MISVDNLTKSYGSRIIFDDVSFKINRRERVGLVGRNGHGKTTLFRIIAGLEEADSGGISIPKGYRIGYVTQSLNFTCSNVVDESLKGISEDPGAHRWKAEKILAGLGFSESDMARSPADLSGGFQVRLNLAGVLLAEPDLLLLDEPTNYLDITSIRWMRKFLFSWPREIFMITHDRGFMDKIATHIVGIYRQKIRKIEGDTSKYYLQIAQEEEIHEKTRINQDRRTKEIQDFISRFRAKARLAGLVQSRIKALDKQTRHNKLEKFKNLEFSFRSQPFNGKFIGTVKDLSFSYGPGKTLIDRFSLTIGARDRICIVGRNGAGKTTLLKLIAEMMPPSKGEFSWHPGTVKGYFEQTNIGSLVEERTVEEEIAFSCPDIDRQTARNICGAMLFEGDAALKKISVLSGGEKSRVMLGKILCTPINLLLLDEPTNHLDMESCDALLAAIDAFEGAVIMVTHNEMFLHGLAERLVVFGDDGILLFDGDYQRFLDKIGWQDEGDGKRAASEPTVDGENETARFSKKEWRRRRSVLVTERGRNLKDMEKEITALENLIDANETELSIAEQRMQVAAEQQDGKSIAELSQRIHLYQSRIDQAFDKLEKVSERYETRKTYFDTLLSQLDASENTFV
jgi:ATP-binding cassette, subfamily F, member 3